MQRSILRKMPASVILIMLPWFGHATFAEDFGHTLPAERRTAPTTRSTGAQLRGEIQQTSAEGEWHQPMFGHWVGDAESEHGNYFRQASQETRPLQPTEPLMPMAPQQSAQADEARRLIGQRTLSTAFASRARRQLLVRNAPPAIGDFFGGAQGSLVTFPDNPFSVSSTEHAVIPNPARPGSQVGRIKMSENGSAIPRDRIYFAYSYFDDVPLTPEGVSVNRFAPGFEKTFFDGMMSTELRIPFATTLNSNILASGATNTDDIEFGNLLATVKANAYTNEVFVLAGGLQMALPTANDLTVATSSSPEILRVENESVHLMPFLASLYVPNDRIFMQSFLQFDFDVNGNPVFGNSFGSPISDTQIGRLNDKSFVFVDWSIGYWIYKSDAYYDNLTGIAPMFELHYNRSLSDNDIIDVRNNGGNQYVVGDSVTDFEVLNLTLGLTFELQQTANLTVGYSVPLAGGSDRDFDGEFRMFYTHRFGPTQRRDAIY